MKVYEQFLDIVEKFFPEDYFRNEDQSAEIAKLIENPQFHELLSNSPSIIGIFNNTTMGYEFLSDNITEIFGYDKSNFTIPGGIEKVLATFKEEHARVFNSYVFPTIFEYFQNCSRTKDIQKYRFTSSFQLKRSDHEYIWCMQQIKAISVDEDGYPVLLLIFIFDITNLKKDDDVDFVIACKDKEEVFKNVHVITIPPSGLALGFSKRELEILAYIKQGLSSKEIADTLVISDHTVNNHRKNILKKANGMNIMEIIQKMSSKKLI